jgi:hypothetical protein
MRETPPCARHAAAIALAVICCGLGIGACGSSRKPTTAAGSSSQSAAGLKLAACMRAHGVSNFPDPTANAGPAPTAAGIDKHSPAFRVAEQACGSLRAALAAVKPHPSRAQQLMQSECMRAHGVPDYPDPLPGGGFSIPSPINPQSPAFQRAQNACEKPGVPLGG